MIFMDDNTQEVLDFQYVLNKIETLTPYGLMYKNRMKAYARGQEEELRQELDKIESFQDIIKKDEIRIRFNNIFAHVKDLRNSIKRAGQGSILTEVELFEIKSFLFLIRDLMELIERYQIPTFADTKIKAIPQLEKALDPEGTGIASFYIYDSYSKDLERIRKKKRQVDEEIRKRRKEIEENIKKDLNLEPKMDSSVIVQKDKKNLIKKIEEYPNLTYQSETYMSIKYSIKATEEMDDLEKKITILKDKEEKEEVSIREKLSKEIANRQKEIFLNMAHIGRLDLLIGKTKHALATKGTKPNILNDHIIDIKEGIHPKARESLKESDLHFTPISLDLNKGVTCITGANMGGKTISLKLVGLLSAMAQYGLFVPAKEMSLGLNDFIKTSIGDMQSADTGLSSFGGEIKIVQEAVKNADKKGLILIDELARGTNPEEGRAISKAIVTYLKEKNSISLITTHYDNVANIEGVVHLQVIGLSSINLLDLAGELGHEKKMELINKYMNYQLRQVKKDTQVPRDAINIAKLMGLEEEIITKAEAFLTNNK